MFIPYRVDVPFNHRPVVNWVVVAGVIFVFCLQVHDMVTYPAEPGTLAADPNSETGFAYSAPVPGGITGRWLLNGWGIKGLFGHMWLHGGGLHLIGNLIFLWLFGNAVCSKIGNLMYLPIYILCGLIAAISHLLFFDVPMLGASGAIMGMVGMYLVFFPENSISCFFIFYFRPWWFTVRSFWMILLWFIVDIFGAASGGGGVAYFAHIGGFASGFALAVLLLKTRMIVMERDETSLLKLIGLEKDDTPAEARRDVEPWQQEWVREKAMTQGVERTGNIAEYPSSLRLQAQDSRAGLSETPRLSPRFVRFRCQCGQRVKIPSKYVGMTGRCPKCSARMKIPPGREDIG